MNTLEQNELRVEKYLTPRMGRLCHLINKLLVDPRDARGKRHAFDGLLLALLAGLLAGKKGLRDVERLSERLALGRNGGRVSDNALGNLLERLDDRALAQLLVIMVKDMKRRGQLRSDGLRRDWIAIDGKYESLNHHANGWAQKIENREAGSIYWRLGALRAVLISAAGRPALGQRVMGPVAGEQSDPDKLKHTGEMSNIRPFIVWLREQYGDLATNFTLDAGLWSRELFAEMDNAGLGIFGGLKKNKPELHAEVERVLRIERGRRAANAESDWEPCKDGQVRRRLWRSYSLDGWNGWTHLRQVVVVEQTTRPRECVEDTVELRYFATNLPHATMSASEVLALVRRHWAIENDCNWTFDVVMGEDAGTWCTKGNAMLALGVLKMIAYNLMQWLRKRHVAVRHACIPDTPRAWRELQEMIFANWVRIGRTLLQRLRPSISS